MIYLLKKYLLVLLLINFVSSTTLNAEADDVKSPKDKGGITTNLLGSFLYSMGAIWLTSEMAFYIKKRNTADARPFKGPEVLGSGILTVGGVSVSALTAFADGFKEYRESNAGPRVLANVAGFLTMSGIIETIYAAVSSRCGCNAFYGRDKILGGAIGIFGLLSMAGGVVAAIESYLLSE